MLQFALSLAATFLTFALFVPYIRSIWSGETQPHAFSWLIWAFGTLVVGVAGWSAGGGLGALVILFSGAVSTYIAWLAFSRRTDVEITRADWFFLFAAGTALPCWFFTSDPFWAVAILTTSDLLGFGPTVRKAFNAPFGEPIGFYVLGAARNALVIGALQTFSVTTILFPLLVGLACLGLAAMIGWRRAVLGSKPT